MADRANASELARRLGVTEGAVRKHVKRGMYRQGRDGLFDAEECRAAWEAGRDPDAALKGIAGGRAVSKGDGTAPAVPESSLARARIAHTAVRAQREHLALQKAKGELIRTDDAFRACRSVIGIVLERMDGAAAQIGARVVGLDAVAAERVARDVLAAVRTEIAAMGSSIKEVADASRSKP